MFSALMSVSLIYLCSGLSVPGKQRAQHVWESPGSPEHGRAQPCRAVGKELRVVFWVPLTPLGFPAPLPRVRSLPEVQGGRRRAHFWLCQSTDT